MGRFDDRATKPARGPLDLLKWKLGQRRPPSNEFLTPRRDNDGGIVHSLASSITWIGHATFVLRLGGLLVATDPVFSQRIAGAVPRLVPPGVPLEKLPSLDVVLVSHNHYDHLDLPTLRRIGPAATYVTPLGNGELLRKAGLPNVVELDWWQTHAHDSLAITCVPARHWSMRAPWNRNDALWSGFVVRGPEGAAYHSGDTALFDGFREIGERAGPIDWAMLPIGAYEPRWFMQPQHMNPDDALAAFEMLGARAFVAMHWGTFRLTDEPLDEPPERIRALFREHGRDARRLWVMDVGETRDLALT